MTRWRTIRYDLRCIIAETLLRWAINIYPTSPGKVELIIFIQQFMSNRIVEYARQAR